MGKLVAILEDEADIAELISVHLKRAGFSVKEFAEVGEFYSFIEMKVPDLLILDLMLPDADGFEVCKSLKKRDGFASIPVIILTARGDETDKVLGLEIGADDYVTKPFSPKELVARVKAVLRRKGEPPTSGKVLIGGGLEIDQDKFEVFVDGEKVDLTATEFRILKYLSEHKGRVFYREQLLDLLWGAEKIVLDRTIDVHIRNLRSKLGAAGNLIKNVRGIGYKLDI